MIQTKIHLTGTRYSEELKVNSIIVSDKTLQLTDSSQRLSLDAGKKDGRRTSYRYLYQLSSEEDKYDFLLGQMINTLKPDQRSALFFLLEKIFLDWVARRRCLVDDDNRGLFNSDERIVEVLASQYPTLEQYELMAKAYSDEHVKLTNATQFNILFSNNYHRLLIALLHQAILAEFNYDVSEDIGPRSALSSAGAGVLIGIRESSGRLTSDGVLILNSLADYVDHSDSESLTEIASGIYSYRSSENGSLYGVTNTYGQGVVDSKILKNVLTTCPWTIQWMVTSLGNIRRLFTSYTGWSTSKLGQKISLMIRDEEEYIPHLLYLGNYGRLKQISRIRLDYDRICKIFADTDKNTYLDLIESNYDWSLLVRVLNTLNDEQIETGVLDIANVRASDHPVTLSSRSLIPDVARQINSNFGLAKRIHTSPVVTSEKLAAESRSIWENLAKEIIKSRKGHNPV